MQNSSDLIQQFPVGAGIIELLQDQVEWGVGPRRPLQSLDDAAFQLDVVGVTVDQARLLGRQRLHALKNKVTELHSCTKNFDFTSNS